MKVVYQNCQERIIKSLDHVVEGKRDNGWGREEGGIDPCLIQYRVYYCIRVRYTYTHPMMDALPQSGSAVRGF